MKKKYAGIAIVAVSLLVAAPAWAGSSLETLGGAIYKDLNLSFNQNQSCMTCHHPSAGFADPENRISPFFAPVSVGSIPTLFGGRNAPSAAYAGFSPVFHYDPFDGLFAGGLFWDGRATGTSVTATGDLGAGPTGDPLADQAKGPFGNPVEMALTMDNLGMSTEEAVVGTIQASGYADEFEKEFGPNAFADIGVAYNNASLAIAAFERSNQLNRFKSKFDKFVAEQGGDVSGFGVVVEPDGFRTYVGPPNGFKSKYLRFDEADGLAIFNADSYRQTGMAEAGPNGGMCYRCHLTENHVVGDNNPANGPAPGVYNPMLTDFTYDNLGIPVNPQIAVLAGQQSTDFGLGAQIAQMDEAYGAVYPYPADENGKFKVATLRNLERTAPYGHNGFFATMEDIVHFYNTRDALPLCEDAGGTVGVDCWPAAEVPETVNAGELGNLGLTLAQENKIVQFVRTLTD